MKLIIRPTTLNDIPALPEIERSAAQGFLSQPALAWLASGPVISTHQHALYVENAMSWLAAVDGKPVAFLLAEAMQASLFIAEVSVHANWQGNGIGKRLIAHLTTYAAAHGYSHITLTTFRHVPWNAPYYQRLGFTVMDDETLTPWLRAKHEEEQQHGLNREWRCAMRKEVKTGQA